MPALTYLQLCNKLLQKCAITGPPLATVSGQTGEMGRVVAWIDEAYLNIQQMRDDWDWMRAPFSFQTIANQGAYTAAQAGVSDLGIWKVGTFRSYLNSVGVRSEVFLGDMEYNYFRDYYLYGNLRLTYGWPQQISIGPDRSLNLGLAPDALGYTIVGDYYKEPSHLSADADVPLLPNKFDMLIVYQAMLYYAAYEAASEVYAEGERLFNAMYKRLDDDQLPAITVGAPLA